MYEDEIREHLNWTDASPVYILYLDFSKAFTLSHILIDKLMKHGLDEWTEKWAKTAELPITRDTKSCLRLVLCSDQISTRKCL